MSQRFIFSCIVADSGYQEFLNLRDLLIKIVEALKAAAQKSSPVRRPHLVKLAEILEDRVAPKVEQLASYDPEQLSKLVSQPSIREVLANTFDVMAGQYDFARKMTYFFVKLADFFRQCSVALFRGHYAGDKVCAQIIFDLTDCRTPVQALEAMTPRAIPISLD